MVREAVAHFAFSQYRWEYWCVEGVRRRDSLHLTSISVRVLVCRWCETAWLTSPYLNIGESIGVKMVWEGVAHPPVPVGQQGKIEEISPPGLRFWKRKFRCIILQNHKMHRTNLSLHYVLYVTNTLQVSLKHNARMIDDILKRLSHEIWVVTERVYYRSVSRFQEKEKRGKMITINDNIKW